MQLDVQWFLTIHKEFLRIQSALAPHLIKTQCTSEANLYGNQSYQKVSLVITFKI